MGHHRIRALLVTADLDLQQLMKRCRRTSRCELNVIRVQSLSDALARLCEDEFHIVMTDVLLADSSGIDTVERLRQAAPRVPLIVLTTIEDEDLEQQALTAGAQDYLLRGEVTPHTLEQAICHAIQRQESLVEIQRLLDEVERSRRLLTEQQQLLTRKNRRLQRIYKTAHRFVDNVSHEFRTPLAVIKDYVSLIREGLAGPVTEEQCRMLDVVGVRTDDLNTMVDDMLDVSKLESGLLGAWRRPCRLADIVESVCPPLAKKSEIKKITFEIDLPDELPEIYCDAEKIGRVIINLVTNALKFCGDPGHVRLWAEAAPLCGEIVVGVSDNGRGIDDEALAEIFQRFKQIKTDIKSPTKGFGLGLNIVKELVDLNFGDLRVKSRLGHGTTFTFTVPVDDPRGVLQRYVRRLQRSRSPSVVAFVRAGVDRTISAADCENVDGFFTYLLRRNDLLFRANTHEWLFVLAVPRAELQQFLERADCEWRRTNRNRPFGQVPRFQMTIDGHWPVETNAEPLLTRFSCILDSRCGRAANAF